jgi:ADP-ribose pyrophosphatase YjhB (NUDIX family)
MTKNKKLAPKLNIFGENRFEDYTKTRIASRAIIIQAGKILLSHEENEDRWMIPGGGQEKGETPKKCCIREVEEETGLLIEPLYKFLTINEYYKESLYVSHYFECEITGEGSMRLTDEETKAMLKPEWIQFSEALEIFSHHQDYAGVDEMRRGMYLREDTALTEWIKRNKIKKIDLNNS